MIHLTNSRKPFKNKKLNSIVNIAFRSPHLLLLFFLRPPSLEGDLFSSAPRHEELFDSAGRAVSFWE